MWQFPQLGAILRWNTATTSYSERSGGSACHDLRRDPLAQPQHHSTHHLHAHKPDVPFKSKGGKGGAAS